jgi:hypothetical protein
MASTPKNWSEEAERWKNRIDIQTATDNNVTDYIQFKIWEYNNDNSVDSALWDFFQEDFEKFVMDIFS